ncbi:MAG: hypothetical protein IJ538_04795 [Clostridia bacterium]|nr:hypothetical protein [Clostridia bacterium]
MKKVLNFLFIMLIPILMIGCGCGNGCKAIELTGAGDRIHDSYTFANSGVQINDDGNVFKIFGSVEKLDDEGVKKEFKIDDDVSHVVAIKLSSIDEDVVKKDVEISVNGVRNYDAEHLNGSDYTFIILEVVPGNTTTISVKWNKDAETKNYAINFDENIELKNS